MKRLVQRSSIALLSSAAVAGFLLAAVTPSAHASEGLTEDCVGACLDVTEGPDSSVRSPDTESPDSGFTEDPSEPEPSGDSESDTGGEASDV